MQNIAQGAFCKDTFVKEFYKCFLNSLLFSQKNISWEIWWGRFHISWSCATEKLNLKIRFSLRPIFLIHQSRYEEKDHRFRIFRHFSWNHSVQNILENSLTFLKWNLKYKYANYQHLMTLTPHVCIDFFIFYNSINTHYKSSTSLWFVK